MEEIEESIEFVYDPETMRTELRLANGEPRGIVIMTRISPKKGLAYFGRTHSEFEKYLKIYKDELGK